MNKHIFFSLIVLLLGLTAGCQANLGILSSTATPQATATATLLPSTPTVTFTPTEIPIEVMTAEQLLEKYLASDGQIDTTALSNEQRTAFSEVLAEYKNEQRGANLAVYNGEAYIDPDSYKMRKINDGRTEQEQTIQMFLPVSQDAEGNLLVKLKNNERIAITDSKNTDWNMIVTDEDDPRINFPQTEAAPNDVAVGRGGLPFVQWLLSLNDEPDNDEDYAQIPIVFLDKNFGGVFLEGKYPRIFPNFRIATIETDTSGNPVVARISIVIWSSFNLFEEGTEIYLFEDTLGINTEDFLQNPVNKQLIEFWEALEENQVYYVGLPLNQTDPFEHGIFANLNGWKGLTPIDKSGQILTRQIKNDKDLMLLHFVYFLKKSQ